MTNTVSTFADTDRQVFTPGIDTHSTKTRQGNITDEGVDFINQLHERLGEESPSHDPDFFDGLQYWSGSLGRYIIELPDKYVESQYQETPYPTFYVVKIDSRGKNANSEIWREITTWQHVHDTAVNEFVAPVDAWGKDAKWCVMRRVYSPSEMNDRADSHEIVKDMTDKLMSGEMSIEDSVDKMMNTFTGDHSGIPDHSLPLWKVESKLHGIGFSIQDPEVNYGYDHGINQPCFFDMGGFRHNDIKLSNVDIFDTDDSESEDTESESNAESKSSNDDTETNNAKLTDFN